MSPSSASPSSRSGSESERGSAAKRSASVTLSSGISTSAESSASVAGRPSLSSRRDRAFCSRASVSPACTGQPDRAAGVGDAAGDRLADPPRGVRGELEALAPVELLDRVHQAEVALLDEVEERQARGLVLLGDRDDEAQVRLHERALGVVALAGGAAQLALLRRGEPLAAGQRSRSRASLPRSICWASRTSSSLVSSGYWPMSVRYSRTRSSSSRSTRSFATQERSSSAVVNRMFGRITRANGRPQRSVLPPAVRRPPRRASVPCTIPTPSRSFIHRRERRSSRRAGQSMTDRRRDLASSRAASRPAAAARPSSPPSSPRYVVLTRRQCRLPQRRPGRVGQQPGRLVVIEKWDDGRRGPGPPRRPDDGRRWRQRRRPCWPRRPTSTSTTPISRPRPRVGRQVAGSSGRSGLPLAERGRAGLLRRRAAGRRPRDLVADLLELGPGERRRPPSSRSNAASATSVKPCWSRKS